MKHLPSPRGPDGTITACMKPPAGTIRLIDAEAGATCQKGEKKVTWSQGSARRGRCQRPRDRERGADGAGTTGSLNGALQAYCPTGKKVTGGGASIVEVVPGSLVAGWCARASVWTTAAGACSSTSAAIRSTARSPYAPTRSTRPSTSCRPRDLRLPHAPVIGLRRCRGLHRLGGRWRRRLRLFRADGGEAARSDDFFRLRGVSSGAERTTPHPAGWGARNAADRSAGTCPAASSTRYLAIWPIRGRRWARGTTLEPGEIDWSGTGLVSVFVRDRIGGEPALAGATERSSRSRSTTRVFRVAFAPRLGRADPPRRARRMGGRPRRRARVLARGAPRPCAGLHRDDAARRRRRALPLRAPYFESIMPERSWLLLAAAPSGEPGAAAIVGGLGRPPPLLPRAAPPVPVSSSSPFKNVVAAQC